MIDLRAIPTETEKPRFDDGEYLDQAWEVVVEEKRSEDFEPMKLEELDSGEIRSESLFEDYGGSELKGAGPRFHVPIAEAEAIQKGKQEEEDPNRLVIMRDELERVKSEAFAAGRAEAEQAAEAKQREHFAQVEQQMSQVLVDIQTQLNESLVAVEKNAVAFSLALAEKIIFRTVEINPEYVTAVIKEAIALSGSATIRRIRVSPQDLEFIEYAGVTRKLGDSGSTWVFEADESIKAGCVVDTSAGEVDYQLDRSWEKVKESVVRVIR